MSCSNRSNPGDWAYLSNSPSRSDRAPETAWMIGARLRQQVVGDLQALGERAEEVLPGGAADELREVRLQTLEGVVERPLLGRQCLQGGVVVLGGLGQPVLGVGDTGGRRVLAGRPCRLIQRQLRRVDGLAESVDALELLLGGAIAAPPSSPNRVSPPPANAIGAANAATTPVAAAANGTRAADRRSPARE
jgi:hypothetical protein